MDSGCKICVGGMNLNCVGIDVSKGKSTIAVMRPLGEIVIPPFEIGHTDAELCELSRLLGQLDGETRIVMEATGNYHMPVAGFLYDSGFYVSVVNAMLVHNYGKTLFQIMFTLIQHAPADDPVFQFLDRKRQEGKHYYVYMTAAANKFLRIYYGTVMAYLEKL